jgi:hypothetical protein
MVSSGTSAAEKWGLSKSRVSIPERDLTVHPPLALLKHTIIYCNTLIFMQA